MSDGFRLVVVGGVAAGMSVASQVKRRNKSAEVVVFEKGRDVSYGACGMPYNAADPGRSPEDLVVITAEAFREKRGLDVRLGHEVTLIDRESKKVAGVKDGGEAFEIGYDILVLATGSRTLSPPIGGLDLEGVFGLRTLADLRGMRSWIGEKKPGRAVIIGGSYLGLELAEAMHARGIDATIVKRKPVMLGFLPPEFDSMVRGQLDGRGIEVIHGEPVRRVSGDGGLSVELESRTLEADMVLVATGFSPRSELAHAAGLELGPAGSIKADKLGRTSDANIYAVGDCSDNFHAITGERVWVPLALHANRGGRIVGGNLAGGPGGLGGEEIPPVLGTSAVRVFDLEVAGTGLNEAEAIEAGFEPATATIKARTRAHAFPGASEIHVHLVGDKKSGRLIGGAIVGGECAAVRINTVAAAIHAGMAVADFANMDLMYSPPFSPAWDPALTCANQLVKKV